jgi:hypothetical protein
MCKKNATQGDLRLASADAGAEEFCSSVGLRRQGTQKPSPQNRPRLCGGAITAAKPRGDFKGETASFPLDDPLLLWTGVARRDAAPLRTPNPHVILSGAKDLKTRPQTDTRRAKAKVPLSKANPTTASRSPSL